jgi:uncharacterized protein
VIRETIVSSVDAAGAVHIAPIGIHVRGEWIIVAPFRPSTTLNNMLVHRCAVVNYCDDVRLFAGCVTGRSLWPTLPATMLRGVRLEGALAHAEVKLERVEDDELRPQLYCRAVHEETHAPFKGFNRAQAAVVEAAILVSRLDRLPKEKIDAELEYLTIAIDKTAGPVEREAWCWIIEHILNYRARVVGEQRA